MENQVKKTVENNTTSKIMRVLKRNVLFILIVVILSTGAGAVFSNLKKPTYTATEKVGYYADVTQGGTNSTANSINAMKAYFETVVDYCKTGCVLDRADFYYAKYLEANTDGNLSVNQFVVKVLSGEVVYEVDEKATRQHYWPSIIVSEKIEGDAQFLFTVSLKSDSAETARKKLRILIFAFDEEIKDSFGGVKSTINEFVNDEADIECYSNVSLVRDVLIGFAIGIGLALLLLYVKELVDNTVKDKEELEEITGSALIAYIETQGGKEDGGK